MLRAFSFFHNNLMTLTQFLTKLEECCNSTDSTKLIVTLQLDPDSTRRVPIKDLIIEKSACGCEVSIVIQADVPSGQSNTI